MYILMWAGGMPFNGKTIPSGKSLGGSETAAYFVAKELAALGHNVVMFTASQEGGKEDGVTYEWHGPINENNPLGERFHFCAQVPFDVAIIQRHPLAFMRFVNAKIRVMWNHDLALRRNSEAIHRSIPYLDFIFGVSGWHRDQICEVYGLDREHVLATSNGIDYGMLEGIDTSRANREPRSLLYTARPERGLENLVKPGGIMERLPDVKLYVCGYDNTQPNMRGYYEYLWSRCAALPNVVNLGPLGKRQLMEQEAKVMLHVYPTTFEDTSCIAAMEAQAAGTPFISCQMAALPETCRGAGAVLLPLTMDGNRPSVNEKLFAKTITRILQGTKEWDDMHEKALAYRRPWSDVALQWTTVFEKRLVDNGQDLDRMAKHLERYSDIVALNKLADKNATAFKILNENYKFFLDGTYAEHYKKYYQYEKDRGVNYGPESLEGNNRFESICRTLTGLLKEKDQSLLRILDYGCAHGHYVMNLRRRFPKIGKWVGVDIEQSNIDTANKWAETEKADNVLFIKGTVENLDGQQEGLFDIVMANEVLEHVPAPAAVVEKLRSLLHPEGYFVASTPYGPWEAIGYDKHVGWRAHLHHFEREDLVEMYAEQPEFQNIAIPHGGELGHFLITFKAGGPAIGEIDYDRKFLRQAPRETLAACLIAKDEQMKLGLCLQKLKPICDVIIVGVDRTTTDGTRDLCKELGVQIVDIESPLVIGFDEARNQTIAEAKTDWIIWVDADEQLENAGAILKYLHNSPVDGIAIAQHHLGVNPPGVQKTDFPCRIFRNNRGIKFYGMVHEHPEKGLNEGIGKVIVADNTAIGHYGYSTEDIRRARFERNFPLMEKDRKKYPNRKLGIMLWVRDLAHIVRYERERNGGQVTQRAVAAAKEAIETWRSMLAWKDEDRTTRLVTDSLVYYSECVHALQGGGIQMAINMAANPMGDVKMPNDPHVGLFAGMNDAKRFADIIMKDTLNPITEKYL
jgi:2-polyprenyl-3-methyl-5-hydroxy-6-metoxy-1,4-benzoquinol methylase/glycosyltransferase involved in cell wall biosynthesis